MLLFLLAAGFTLIFGLMGILNLSHGTLYLLAGYVAVAVAPTQKQFFHCYRKDARNRYFRDATTPKTFASRRAPHLRRCSPVLCVILQRSAIWIGGLSIHGT
jgi:ABC-type branched-subunit amino acid transport system permease subunit